jgi:predicted ribosomally synthesized peptide with SipW-like signal peptide
MTKKFVEAALIASCALVLMFATIAGTIAYLTSTATIQNTFTSGKVAITMDEAKVDIYGVKVTPETRVTGSDPDTANIYKLLPGKEYIKDPIIHVEAKSEKCLLYVKIKNEIKAIEDTNETIAAQLDKNWTKLSENGNESIWYYESEVDASTGAKDINVFESFTIDKNIQDLSAYEGKTITVTAYAIQADGVVTQASDFADKAAKTWAAAPADWKS